MLDLKPVDGGGITPRGTGGGVTAWWARLSVSVLFLGVVI